MLTMVYNIAFADSIKQAYLHFRGCNIACRGCILRKIPFDSMLDRNMDLYLAEPDGEASMPNRFIDFDGVIDTLVDLEARSVLFEGQEASLDPAMPLIAETLHRRLSTTNILLTNGLNMPDLAHVDRVAFGLKAFDEDLHIDYTGHSNQLILKNFKRIYDSGVPMLAETVVIPGYIDSEEIEKLARFIASIDSGMLYHLDAYSRVADNPWPRATVEDVEKAALAARKHLNNVHFLRDAPREFSVRSIFPTEAELDFAEQPSIKSARIPVLV
ncbi:radical SAM protein [Dehalogenimonas etheniformans]|uniref:Radical SAM protein n=1 Tax=Dehalogenimonas etheniformans TaxID=1536648 RepID=A0A2P5P8A8_9CHLR|nr:radical SAM protein [Dehalogenimonas etheniformans]PPD58530.1 radical SAM protein [Dehalogenimonas etheniformans]QNT76706.1 radical SAM protein [Dehalogenimonas etheniformans]